MPSPLYDPHGILLDRLLTDEPPDSGGSSRLEKLIGNRKIVVYGCGDGLITFTVFILEKFGLHPEVLLDTKFLTPTLHDGIPAMSPTDFNPTEALLNDAVAIITVGKKRYHTAITSTLRTLGFQNIILASDIYEYHLSHAPCGFEQLGPGYFRRHTHHIHKAYALLEDDASREVFTQVLQTHVHRTPTHIRHEALEHQYFPRDLTLSQGVSRFINCGSYDGDTVRQLNARHGPIEALACFEPDKNNFSALQNMLSEHPGVYSKSVIAFPCGVWETETQLRFSGNNRINSSINDGGDTVIQCVALDHVIPDFAPTFINMDIEGAEPLALAGATNLIRQHAPDLAICVYHLPEHLWEIALQIQAIQPRYRFFLRNYTGFPAETVLYATI